MKAPGWYPSVEYPGREQWWDGEKFTQNTRWGVQPKEQASPKAAAPVIMNKQLLAPSDKPARRFGNDWFLNVPIILSVITVIWITFAAYPFIVGERSVSYDTVNATVMSVRFIPATGYFSKKLGASPTCAVKATFTKDDVSYIVDAGTSCDAEQGMKAPITYDPKDINATATTASIPLANFNFILSVSTLGALLASIGILQYIRKPTDLAMKRVAKPRKRQGHR